MARDQSELKGDSGSIKRQRDYRVSLHGLHEMGIIGEFYREGGYGMV